MVVARTKGITKIAPESTAIESLEQKYPATIGSRVEGRGPTSAQLICIGETPGAEEVEQGQPFVGRSGVELMSWVQASGINLESIRFDNICQVRPPDNDFNQIPGTDTKYDGAGVFESKARGWLNDLQGRLAKLPNLKVIVGVGGWVGRLFLNKENLAITQCRGDVHKVRLPNGKYVWLVLTIHPSYMLHSGQFHYRFLCLRDLTKARLLLNDVDPVDEQPILYVASRLAQAYEYLDDLSAHLRKDPECWLAIDTETMGQGIDTISFGIKRPNGYLISANVERYIGYAIGFQGKDGPLYSFEEEFKLWQRIRDILSLPNPKVLQNAPYDLRFLTDMGIPIINIKWDTLWAAHVRSPALPRSLDVLSSLYTWVNYYKEERQAFGKISLERRWNYAACDGAVTLQVRDGQYDELKRSPNLLRVLHHRQMPMLVPFHEMEVKGVPCNVTILRTRAREIKTELGPEQDKLRDLRYGTHAHSDWTRTLSVGRRVVEGFRLRLEQGAIQRTCSKCSGTGTKVLTSGKVTNCRSCKGIGTRPLKKWKTLARYFDQCVTKYEKLEPTVNVKGTAMKSWLFSGKRAGGLGLPGKRTEKGNLRLDEEVLQHLRLRVLSEQTKVSMETLPSPKKTVDCLQPKTSKQLHLRHCLDVLDNILLIRSLRTELENFTDLKISPDGRFRTSFAPLEDTGRCHSRPDQYGYGRNFQNFPRGGAAKRAIEAPPGYIFGGFDLKQAESVIAHWDAHDLEYVEAILEGIRDVHSEATEIGFGIKREDYPADEWEKLWRQGGKRLKHGFTYGMGPRRAWEQILTDLPGFNISQLQVKIGLLHLAGAYSLVETRKSSLVTAARYDRCITSPYGRVYFFYGPWNTHMEKVALAYRPQSATADYLNGGRYSVGTPSASTQYSGLVGMHNAINNNDLDAYIISQKHDECVWLVREDQLQRTFDLALEMWSVPMTPVSLKDMRTKGRLIIPMEFFKGQNLRDLKEVDAFNESINWLDLYRRIA